MSTRLMEGKRGLIMGVANNKSIAWGIAKACAAHGAELALSYQNDVLRKRIEPLAESIGSSLICECDVSDPKSMDSLFETLRQSWNGMDFVVHAIGFFRQERTARPLC